MSSIIPTSTDFTSSILTRFQNLDVTKVVSDITAVLDKRGGSSDIFRGKLHRSDGTSVEIAIKRIRTSYKEDRYIAKVRP